MTTNTTALDSSALDSSAADPFAPARLGSLHLRNRLITCAAFEGRTPDVLVTDGLIDFHREVDVGGVEISTVAYCAIFPEGRTDCHQIWLRPEAAAGLVWPTEALHTDGSCAAA